MLATATVALLALAGCGGSHNNAASNSAGSTTGGLAVGAPAGAGDSAKSPDAANQSGSTPLQQRALVRTASMAVTVSDVDRAANSALAATIAAGGRVDGDDRTDGSSGRHADLVLRVPADKLDGLIGTVGRLGHEDSRTVHGQDVTATQADVGARVQELTISVARLQDFLKHSGSIADLVALESQLTQRESDLQSTVAQQRALSDQIELASLTVDLHTKAGLTQAGSGPAGFGSALRHALDGLLLSVRWAAALLGYLLPFLVVLAIPGVPAMLWWRRARRNRRTPVAPPQPATE
ncbi:MAG TPA: DUF4349 domain-containing protein [Jatrophihabitans sp.]|nr:DUF4349 domain-containing protein [Jatrophihabitans sp.]